MDKLEQLRDKFIDLPKKVEEFIGDSLRENTAFIEDLNAAQLNEGIRADGSEITPAYTELTKRIKKLKGQPIDRVTLKDQGKFHAGITAEFPGESLEIIGKDEKTTILEQKYGIEILGLTESNLNEVNEEVLKPDLIDKTKDYLDI